MKQAFEVVAGIETGEAPVGQGYDADGFNVGADVPNAGLVGAVKAFERDEVDDALVLGAGQAVANQRGGVVVERDSGCVS